MVKIRRQDCGKVIEGKKSDVDNNSCDCNGALAVLGSEDDSYEPNECDNCKKDIGDGDSHGCDECECDHICDDCMTDFENVSLCKKCLYKKHPQETKIEYQEKIVEKPVKVYVDKEGIPLDSSFNPLNKSKFD